jgi:hypothetical protein
MSDFGGMNDLIHEIKEAAATENSVLAAKPGTGNAPVAGGCRSI